MKKFEPGDIVYYRYKNLKCVVNTWFSNSVFERTYTIESCDTINGRHMKFKVKCGNIELYKEWKRNNNIDNILNE